MERQWCCRWISRSKGDFFITDWTYLVNVFGGVRHYVSMFFEGEPFI